MTARKNRGPCQYPGCTVKQANYSQCRYCAKHANKMRTARTMSTELAEELESRAGFKRESVEIGEIDDEDTSQEALEIAALEDLVNMEDDYGGLFEQGLIPDFKGSPEWVAEMKRKQAANLADFERQRQEWLKLWREAKRELARRTKATGEID